jgi:hypothetical protein
MTNFSIAGKRLPPTVVKLLEVLRSTAQTLTEGIGNTLVRVNNGHSLNEAGGKVVIFNSETSYDDTYHNMYSDRKKKIQSGERQKPVAPIHGRYGPGSSSSGHGSSNSSSSSGVFFQEEESESEESDDGMSGNSSDP